MAKRNWAVLFYLVVEPYSGEEISALSDIPLNTAADADLAAIKSAAERPVNQDKSLYVAYQVVRGNQRTRGTVHDKFEKTEPKTDSSPLAMFLDLSEFVTWATGRCEADRYAMFFWGHSLGPAGLFDLADSGVPAAENADLVRLDDISGGSIGSPDLSVSTGGYLSGLPSPEGLPGGPFAENRLQPPGGALTPRAPSDLPLRAPSDLSPRLPSTLPADMRPVLILENFKQALSVFRERGLPALGPNYGGGTGSAGGTGGPGRLEVLVLKNCYMSTLEVATELKDVAHYMLASQSQVPIWRWQRINKKREKQPGVWPYDTILGSFSGTSLQTAKTIFAALKSYYSNSDRRAKFPVPYSLLNLERVDDAVTKFHGLAKKLRSSTNEATRATLFAKVHTGPLKKKPGNVALLDLDRLCSELVQKAAFEQEARALKTALGNVIKQKFSLGAGTSSGCRGLSVYYDPTETLINKGESANDFDLSTRVNRNDYSRLALGKLDLGQDNAGKNVTWTDLALEQ
jgi:hypothetical protein